MILSTKTEKQKKNQKCSKKVYTRNVLVEINKCKQGLN